MRPEHIESLLLAVRKGALSPEEALEELRLLPFRGAAGILADTHRLLRQGFPEAVFAEGKTPEQVAQALQLLTDAQEAALATRVNIACAALLSEKFPGGVYDEVSRLFRVGRHDEGTSERVIGVVSAGTSDLPVAEEAAGVLEFSGRKVFRIEDSGVAGLHRLLARLEEMRACSVLIVVAGMEGALPSVVGGLVGCPVIAVPTSVGYGASFAGLAPLLTMLNSCASGVTVVNIDNGYGAAVAALRILNQGDAETK